MKSVSKFIIIAVVVVLFLSLLFFLLQKRNYQQSYIPDNPKNTAVQTEFINTDDIKIDDSLLGFSISKLSPQESTLGKNSIYLSDYTPKSVEGTEWLGVRENLTEQDFSQIKSLLQNYSKTEFQDKGWLPQKEINDETLRVIVADGPTGGTWGYIKNVGDEIQVVVFSTEMIGSRAEVRIFVSEVVNINSL